MDDREQHAVLGPLEMNRRASLGTKGSELGKGSAGLGSVSVDGQRYAGSDGDSSWTFHAVRE